MSDFIKRIEQNLEGLEAFNVGACPGCPWCGLEDTADDDWRAIELAQEPEFSWSECHSCGSTLGGDRHPAHAYQDDTLVHFSICTDCLLFHANGDMPC